MKVLFGPSVHCAFPGCTNPIVQAGTAVSKDLVLAQICHIEASSDAGPRANPARPARERDAPENLLLLCPTHHAIVDGQHETYPEAMLRDWKREQMRQAERAVSMLTAPNAQPGNTGLADRELRQVVDALRKSRFFVGRDAVADARNLVGRMTDGDLSLASPLARSHAFGWCMRIVAFRSEPEFRRDLLSKAAGLQPTDELTMARAFFHAADGDEQGALQLLASLDGGAVRTAAFQVVRHKRDLEGALEWLDAAGLGAADLDADGRLVLLITALTRNEWDKASDVADGLSQADFENQPALHYAAALANLLFAVPEDLRPFVRAEVPIEARHFPLSSEPEAMKRRRAAEDLFHRGASAAAALDAGEAAEACALYSAWLGLRGPDNEAACQQVAQKLTAPDEAVAWIPLALQFEIPVKLAEAERAIDRQTALRGGVTQDGAKARLALAFAQGDAAASAVYLERHRASLLAELDAHSVNSVLAEFLAAAGETGRAQAMAETELPPEAAARLQAMLKARIDQSAVELENEFEATKATSVLAQLVAFYEQNGPADLAVDRAALLFERTGATPDAERLSHACLQAEDWPRLKTLIETVPHLVGTSLPVTRAATWQAFWEGDLQLADGLLALVMAKEPLRTDRLLFANLAITSGKWERLGGLVEDEWAKRDERSSGDLFWIGRIAQVIGSARAKDLIRAAVGDADNPHVFLGGYVAATEGGWEEEEEPARWLNEAAQRSDEAGPIKWMTLPEAMSGESDWNQKVEETWRSFRAGDMPIVLAAHALRRSMIDLQLLPLLTNHEVADLRKRPVVPLFSGVRAPLDIDGKIAALDVTTLFTLAALGLIEEAFGSFERIVLAHETLSWLFEERQRAAFHQPSRFMRAEELKGFVVSSRLNIFSASDPADDELAVEVGPVLAGMLTSAVKASGKQRLVVHPTRITRAGSLGDEEVDASAFKNVLTGCLPVLEKLRSLGALNESDYRTGLAYLTLHEKEPWPDAPAIERGAELLLDDVALAYFQHIGALGKIAAAGFTVFVPDRAVREADGLLALQRGQEDIERVLTDLRESIVRGLESGRVQLAPAIERIPRGDDRFERHPTLATLRLANDVDVLITDDRYINRHNGMETGETDVPIASSLDLIDLLAKTEVIGRDRWLDLRNRLREGGAALVELRPDELAELLAAAGIAEGEQNETAELKAIRGNLLLVLMKGWLNLPTEATWFDRTMLHIGLAVREQWTAGADPETAKARCRWLLDLAPMDRWASSFGGLSGESMARLGDVVVLKRFAVVPPDLEDGPLREAYEDFFDNEIFGPAGEDRPQLVSILIDHLRELIIQSVSLPIGEAR